ncbi:zinc metalloproteinase nas-6-like [Dendronephthya gigantea]|uniref:zinc metalloproteinase nas-6-like n=1 Tax=Dendronephthya gigantea TaxID=151771 RepID=UPI00106C9EA8|nr:zinc metalloproteinase nas-6-like [Dendronephthya gigantea]
MIPVLAVMIFFQHQTEAKTMSSTPTLIEGDIVYDEQFKILTGQVGLRKRRDMLSDRGFHWKNAVVPYEIESNMSIRGRKVIRRAFREIAKRSCVSFIPRQDDHDDYVSFVIGKGCYSSIGRVGGRQVVSLHEDCKYRGKVIHEILHALGFFHEHSRSDRDKYIRVIWKNIMKGMRRNFVSYKHGPIDALGEPYDFNSIMHYDNKAFTKNGGDTIRSLTKPKMRLGQLRRLTKIDVSQINKLYRCKERKAEAKCFDFKRNCKLRTSKTDVCEAKYKVMKESCAKSCAFCG